MQAWQVIKNGEPEDALELGEKPVPEPGPGEVRIRVKAVARRSMGRCRRDARTRHWRRNSSAPDDGLVTSLTPSTSHGATLGMRLTSNRLAQITVPLAVGAFASPLGVLGIFWANAGLLLGAIAIMVFSGANDCTD